MDTGSYKTMTVKTDSIVLQSLYSARIEGRQDVEIYPQVSGTLQRLCVQEGDRVKKGQTLFIIDQVPYQAALNTAEANLKAAEAAEKSFSRRRRPRPESACRRPGRPREIPSFFS